MDNRKLIESCPFLKSVGQPFPLSYICPDNPSHFVISRLIYPFWNTVLTFWALWSIINLNFTAKPMSKKSKNSTTCPAESRGKVKARRQRLF